MAFRINNIGDLKNIGNPKMREQALKEYKQGAAEELQKLEPQPSLFSPSDTVYKIVLPFPPSLNMMYPQNMKTGKRFLSKRGKEFKEAAKKVLEKSPTRILQGKVWLTIRIYRPRKSGDGDNYIKPSQDALKGFFFNDDEQVCRWHVDRLDDKYNPRVEIDIREL